MIEAFDDHALTIIVSGTKDSETKIFMGKKRVGYVQDLTFKASQEQVVPSVNLSIVAFELRDEPYTINKMDAVIICPNFVQDSRSSLISNSTIVTINNTAIGVLNGINLNCGIGKKTELEFIFDKVSINLVSATIGIISKYVPWARIVFC